MAHLHWGRGLVGYLSQQRLPCVRGFLAEASDNARCLEVSGSNSYTSSWHQYDTTSAPALGGPILPERHGNRVALGRSPIFMPLGACKGIPIPTEMPLRAVFMRGRVQATPAWTIPTEMPLRAVFMRGRVQATPAWTI